MHHSTSAEICLPLQWVSILAGRTKLSLAASTGVGTGDDVVKYLLTGADTTMTTSAILRHGAGHVGVLLGALQTWMERREFGSIGEIRGLLSWTRSQHKELYGRPSYIKMLAAGPGV